jgi:hypothetical protein
MTPSHFVCRFQDFTDACGQIFAVAYNNLGASMLGELKMEHHMGMTLMTSPPSTQWKKGPEGSY